MIATLTTANCARTYQTNYRALRLKIHPLIMITVLPREAKEGVRGTCQPPQGVRRPRVWIDQVKGRARRTIGQVPPVLALEAGETPLEGLRQVLATVARAEPLGSRLWIRSLCAAGRLWHTRALPRAVKEVLSHEERKPSNLTQSSSFSMDNGAGGLCSNSSLLL